MMKSKLIFYPDKNLLTKCNLVDFKITDTTKIKNVVEEMKNEIKNVKGFFENNCIGMSSNQLGYNHALFIMSKYPKHEKLKNKVFDVIINPEVVEQSEKKVLKWEGCVSDKEHLLLLSRPEEIKIKFQDFKGNFQIVGLPPVRSRIAQHELDHLLGLDLYEYKIYDKVRIKELEEDEDFFDEWVEEARIRQFLV